MKGGQETIAEGMGKEKKGRQEETKWVNEKRKMKQMKEQSENEGSEGNGLFLFNT